MKGFREYNYWLMIKNFLDIYSHNKDFPESAESLSLTSTALKSMSNCFNFFPQPSCLTFSVSMPLVMDHVETM